MRIEPLLIVDGCEPKQAVPAVNRVVNSGATSPLVADTIKPHYFFRTIGRDDQQGPFAADYIAKQLKPQKVAILHDKQTYGSGLATQVQKSLQKDGVNVVQP
jgi:branched-chain amino acid transport system substrate-binding protein